MEREKLAEVLREMVEEETGDPCPPLEPDADLRTALNLDSVDLIGVVFRIENRFKIEIPSSEFGDVTTVKQLLDLLQKKIDATAVRQAA
jgi:acyl carrier protein